MSQKYDNLLKINQDLVNIAKKINPESELIKKLERTEKVILSRSNWNHTNIRRVAETLSKKYKLKQISYQISRDGEMIFFLEEGYLYAWYYHPSVKETEIIN